MQSYIGIIILAAILVFAIKGTAGKIEISKDPAPTAHPTSPRH